MDVVLGGGEGGFGVGSAVADAGGGGAVLLVEARIARAAPEAENLDFVFELVSAQPPTRRVYRFNGPCSEPRFTISVGKTEISVIFSVFATHREANFGPESE